MVDDILSTLHQMLIDERKDLRSLSHTPSRDTVTAMSLRMSEAINMVMQLQDLLLAGQVTGEQGVPTPLAQETVTEGASVTEGTAVTSDAAAQQTSARDREATTPHASKRGRGAPKGEFLCHDTDHDAYVAYLTYIIDHYFVDATHMDVTSVHVGADIKTTHFFACLFVLESTQAYTVAVPANKSFYDLVHEAAMQSRHASSFTMNYPSLNKCIGELKEFQVSSRGEGKACLLEMNREERKARSNRWHREMRWMEDLRKEWPPVKA